MSLPALQRRTLALIAVVTPILLLFVYVALRSGPLAPVAVTVVTVNSQAITPALAGIGTVQARYTYKIGPTFAGRLKWLDVHVGDLIEAGQILGEMDPVDLSERIVAQHAAIKSSEAVVRQAEVKHGFAEAQVRRYEQLKAEQSVSEELLDTRRQEWAVAAATLTAAREDVVRLRAELEVLHAQQDNLQLVAPVAGLVAARDIDPGTTVVSGQTVVELIDPDSLWIDARFDQHSAEGLAADLSARIVLRSRRSQPLSGQVLRIEPLADAVTEEILAKIAFATQPMPLPPVGELAEVTVQLPELPAAATIPNAAIRTVNGVRGVWKVTDGKLVFTPIVPGRFDSGGMLQVSDGLEVGDQIVVYSEKALSSKSRLNVVESLVGLSR
ncbi:MAG: efflux RND transporter periplasmic adaptor subunit [Thiohalomonadaceae bacterium]